MKELEAILKQFESFVKRVLLPSSSFVIFFIVYDISQNKHEVLNYLNGVKSLILMIIIVVAFAGLSTVLNILTQAIFDNYLKENFDAKFIFTSENKALKELREQVIAKLPNSEYNDYLLYQEVAKKEQTDKYVDQAKEVGIVFVSLLLVLIISIVTLLLAKKIFWSIALFISLFPIYILGKELVKSRYRSRARRTYINYINEFK